MTAAHDGRDAGGRATQDAVAETTRTPQDEQCESLSESAFENSRIFLFVRTNLPGSTYGQRTRMRNMRNYADRIIRIRTLQENDNG